MVVHFHIDRETVYCSNCIIASLIVVNKFPNSPIITGALLVSPPAGIHDKGPIGLMNDLRLKSEPQKRPAPFYKHTPNVSFNDTGIIVPI